jgi:hypothetical protein
MGDPMRSFFVVFCQIMSLSYHHGTTILPEGMVTESVAARAVS